MHRPWRIETSFRTDNLHRLSGQVLFRKAGPAFLKFPIIVAVRSELHNTAIYSTGDRYSLFTSTRHSPSKALLRDGWMLILTPLRLYHHPFDPQYKAPALFRTIGPSRLRLVVQVPIRLFLGSLCGRFGKRQVDLRGRVRVHDGVTSTSRKANIGDSRNTRPSPVRGEIPDTDWPLRVPRAYMSLSFLICAASRRMLKSMPRLAPVSEVEECTKNPGSDDGQEFHILQSPSFPAV